MSLGEFAFKPGRQEDGCAAVRGGDRDEPLGAGWAPLREPSLRSGSLRSAQPAPSGDVITERFLQGLRP